MYLQPSFLVVYEEEIHLMPLLIEGPKQPGNNIDVYLKPLIRELLMIWNDGIQVWDEDKRETFTLGAMLFITIQDLPALGSLSFVDPDEVLNLTTQMCRVHQWYIEMSEIFNMSLSDANMKISTTVAIYFG